MQIPLWQRLLNVIGKLGDFLEPQPAQVLKIDSPSLSNFSYEQYRGVVVDLRNQVSKLKLEVEHLNGKLRLAEEHWRTRMPAYRQEQFWDLFIQDIQNTKDRIVIVCPFLTDGSVARLATHLTKAVERGVKVVAIVRPRKEQRYESAYDTLEALPITVEPVERFHHKFALLDDILWEGSMNVLSHLGRTKGTLKDDVREHMRRINNLTILKETMRIHGLTKWL